MEEADKEYLQQLNKAFFESSTQFDKQLLFFSAGAFGLSFAFIKDIVALNLATDKNILIIAWAFFGAVILLSVISHYTSLKAINYKIQNIHINIDKISKRLNTLTKWFNIMMILFLASGLTLLTYFIAINI
ncbi:MAG: hypothetical protein M3Q58_06795 [Bacteroidota bacterium]|nr:hypothetical protein [Bacteroidota bacterium]